jgi:hypothetical protein
VRRSLTEMDDGLVGLGLGLGSGLGLGLGLGLDPNPNPNPNQASLIPRESSYPVPGFLPSEGNFETTFVDETLRISRGGWPGNELRVRRTLGLGLGY